MQPLTLLNWRGRFFEKSALQRGNKYFNYCRAKGIWEERERGGIRGERDIFYHVSSFCQPFISLFHMGVGAKPSLHLYDFFFFQKLPKVYTLRHVMTFIISLEAHAWLLFMKALNSCYFFLLSLASKFGLFFFFFLRVECFRGFKLF